MKDQIPNTTQAKVNVKSIVELDRPAGACMAITSEGDLLLFLGCADIEKFDDGQVKSMENYQSCTKIFDFNNFALSVNLPGYLAVQQKPKIIV